MMKSNLRTIVVLVVTAVLIIGVIVVVRQPWNNPSSVTSIDVSIDPNQPAPEVGKPAPEFAAITIDDEIMYLHELRGKPVWLVFGATWCTNCRAEAPDVQAVSEIYDGRVTVMSIYVGESPETVAGYADRLKLTNPQVPDSMNEIASTYSALGLPTHVFIDAEGTVQKIIMGTMSKSRASQVLDSLL